MLLSSYYFKNIIKKLILIEVPKKPELSTNSKYVNSFTIDPVINGSKFQASSFCGNEVAIWDLRNFEKPLDKIIETNNILKISWSPMK
jgi:hypothetical protein